MSGVSLPASLVSVEIKRDIKQSNAPNLKTVISIIPKNSGTARK
jgi:hypothetical protein